MCENFDICRNQVQILRPLEDEQCVVDTRPSLVEWLLDPRDIWATLFSVYLLVFGSHRDMCHKSVLYQSRRRRQRNNNIDIYIPGNPFHVSGTSENN